MKAVQSDCVSSASEMAPRWKAYASSFYISQIVKSHKKSLF